ncbi:hypothetical protein AB1Y20_005415 [Prymnesium parvum]|uniref:sphinganine-1-phosphate aldolase n=1 Tax=Prymnesium parvum TaxID=97485 RepID=A0AB34J477_PRYPA
MSAAAYATAAAVTAAFAAAATAAPGPRTSRIERALSLSFVFSCALHVAHNGTGKVVRSLLRAAFKRAAALPGVRGAIQGELDKEVAKIERKMHGDGDPTAVLALPDEGLRPEDVRALALARKRDEDKSGQSWGGIYHDISGGTPLTKLQADMWAEFNNTNALYPAVFSSVRKFEAEVIAMTTSLLHGDRAVGLLSSGGTESILIAFYTYREMARERGISEPEVIACLTVHPALDKACHYFGLKLIKVRADPLTQKLRATAVRRAITRSTIAIYASAPTFPHGVVDPVEELSALAVEKGVGLHVDNCLGGFYLSFLAQAGLYTPKWDFALPGVTTISIDVHKYGFSSKGASVIAFRDPELRRLSWFPITDGPSIYVTPTMQEMRGPRAHETADGARLSRMGCERCEKHRGARSGATMASAWATLMYMGKDGYMKATLGLHAIFEQVRQAVRETDGVRLLVDSDLAVVPIASDSAEINIYAVASMMERRGWNMFTAQKPPAMSFCIGEQHKHLIPKWAADLKESVAAVRADPGLKIEGDAAVYGAIDNLPAEVLDSVARSYLDVKLSVKPTSQHSK